MRQSLSRLGQTPPVALIIDEQRGKRFAIGEALQREGWLVHHADTLPAGLLKTAARRPDLIVLDVSAFDPSVLHCLRDLRALSPAPVIVASAQDADSHKIAALDAGADVVLTQSLSIGELAARAGASIRRTCRRSQRAGIPVRGACVSAWCR